jgi:LmbE family N-acetylglucosaminyl deacetylase
MVRMIRAWGEPGRGPDLVLVNRPNDYHRDHRYTAQLVLDTTYVLTVPLMCPEVLHLSRMPVFAYWYDRFREGGRFRPDVVVPIDAVMGRKITLGIEHASQLFEWLPFNSGTPDQVPEDAAGRLEFARRRFEARAAAVRDHCAPPDAPFRFAEAFQISEYGRQPDAAELRELFPVGESGIVNART